MNIGDKVRVRETYRKYHVLVARKGTVGVISELRTDLSPDGGNGSPTTMALLDTSNGSVRIPISHLLPYEKRDNTMSDEELVEAFELLVAKEIQSNAGRAARDKMLSKIERYRKEIVRRMSRP